MPLDVSSLSAAETHVLKSVSAGETADVTSVGGGIRAEVLRALLLGLATSGGDGRRHPIPCGVFIRGARVIGELNLAHMGSDHEGARLPLSLENCEISKMVLDGAQLGSLELINCRMSYLSAARAHFDGRVRIVDLRSSELEPYTGMHGEGACWVDLNSTHVDGDVRVQDSRFCLPEAERGRNPFVERRGFALNLAGARIERALVLQPGVSAIGGVNLSDTRVKGAVWACGLESVAADADAVLAQFADFGGFVGFHAFRHPREGVQRSRFSGTVSLFNARVAGTVSFNGAVVTPPAANQISLNLCNSAIAGDLNLVPFYDELAGDGSLYRLEITGPLALDSMEVGGSLDLDRAELTQGRPAISGVDMRISRSLRITGCRIVGDVNFADSRIGGHLTVDDSRIESSDSSYSANLNFQRMRIGGNVSLSTLVSGAVQCDGARVEGDFQVGLGDKRPLEFDFSAGTPPALSLEGAVVAGTFFVGGIRPAGDSSAVELTPALKAALNSVVAAHAMPLVCYPGLKLVELTCGDDRRVLSALWNGANKLVLLPGTSAPVHAVNRTGALRLENTEAAAAYLRFFCSVVWSTAGAFRILEGPDDPYLATAVEGGQEIRGPEVRSDGPLYRAEAVVVYDRTLFRAKFRIERDGAVTMEDDTPLGAVQPRYRYEPPFRLPVHPDDGTAARIAGEWTTISDGDVKQLVQVAHRSSRGEWPRAKFNLENCSIGALDDRGGRAWGLHVYLILNAVSIRRLVKWQPAQRSQSWARFKDQMATHSRQIATFRWPLRFAAYAIGALVLSLMTALRLVSAILRPLIWLAWQLLSPLVKPIERLFRGPTATPSWWMRSRYEAAQHFPIDEAEWFWRLQWLRLQYATYEPTAGEFSEQVYSELARAYQSQGQTDEATRLLSERLTIERRVRASAPMRLVLWLWWLGFDYGLSPRRAILTALLAIALGGWGVGWANRQGLLVVDTVPTATMVVQRTEADGAVQPLTTGTPLASDDSVQTAIPCSDSIMPVLYAADVFVPLLDLRQEPRCQIRAYDSSRDPVVWNGEVDLRTAPASLGRLLADPRFWSVLHAVYAFVGAVVTSLVVLTITGVTEKALLRSQ